MVRLVTRRDTVRKMRWLAAFAVIVGSSVVAAAEPMTVTATWSPRTAAGPPTAAAIVTESTVRTPDGDVVVSQLGGTVDGIDMIARCPGPPPLQARHGRSRSRRTTALDLDRRIARRRRRRHASSLAPELRAHRADQGRPLPVLGVGLHLRDDRRRRHDASCRRRRVPAIIDASIATWNDRRRVVLVPQGHDAGRRANAEVGGTDSVNLIKFRDSSWCRPRSATTARAATRRRPPASRPRCSSTTPRARATARSSMPTSRSTASTSRSRSAARRSAPRRATPSCRTR